MLWGNPNRGYQKINTLVLEKCHCQKKKQKKKTSKSWIKSAFCTKGLSISARKCHLNKWHNISSTYILPAWQSAPDQFNDSLWCTLPCSTELNAIIGSLSGFLGRYSFVPWYCFMVWNPATAPSSAHTRGECLSHRTSWVTVRRTDVINGSEQTPLPSKSHRHTLLNKRQTIHMHLCSPWHYICNTSPASPLSSVLSNFCGFIAWEMHSALLHPAPPSTTSILHLCSSTIKRLLSAVLSAIPPFLILQRSGRGKAARTLQIIISSFTSASLLSAVVFFWAVVLP